MACQSLRQAESNLCLVGGVNLVLSPEGTITFSQARMMAADGRCKTFDASADGYVRGEGCGIVVLKRLADAQADGNPILAVIQGSAVNQDGLTNGLTAPNGPAQQAVIRQALRNAGIHPHQISYVEAHGTGTALGDPIEVKSLKTILMEARTPEQPCWIGSVKTNIGHLETAAGIAGLIKVVLALHYEEIPPHLHLTQLNRYIKLGQTPIKIPTQRQPWPRGEQVRVAGVSSFGFGGTNAHVVLGEAPGKVGLEINPMDDLMVHSLASRVQDAQGRRRSEDRGRALADRPWQVLTLSAKDEGALRALARRYGERLAQRAEETWADVCFSANVGRSHFNHRLCVLANAREQMQDRLAAFTAGQDVPGLFHHQLQGTPQPKVAFLCTGQGSQYLNMGRQLYETHPRFRQTLERCDHILRDQLAQPLLSVLYPEVVAGERQGEYKAPQQDPEPTAEPRTLNQTLYTQPALFALEYALADLWRSWGIEPQIVLGHSVGEYVAACLAGVFSLEDGLKLIAARAQFMQELPTNGEMVVVFAEAATVATVVQPWGDAVAIAAFNGPENVVISGEQAAMAAVVAQLQAQEIAVKPLAVSHAFHSALMTPMLSAFRQVAATVTYHPPQLDLISNLTGKLATAEIATADYWCRHVREPVRFADSMEQLAQLGGEIFLEIGPKPTLLGMGRRCLPPETGLWLPSLRSGQPDWQQMLESLGQLYVHGLTPNWSQFDHPYDRTQVPLPTYPWQRQRYYLDRRHPLPHGTVSAAETPVVQLLQQGKVQALTQLLSQTHPWSAAQAQLLPTVIRSLVQQHQGQRLAESPANWLYQVDWQRQDIPTGEATTPWTEPGQWLLFTDDIGVGPALVAYLQQQGQRCTMVTIGPHSQTDPHSTPVNSTWGVDPTDPEALVTLIQAVLSDPGWPLKGIIHLWGLTPAVSPDQITPATLEQAQTQGCLSLMHLLQGLIPQLPTSTRAWPQLWVVTQGVAPIAPVASKPQAALDGRSLLQAPLWGLGKVIALEHPYLWGGLIDIDPDPDPQLVAQKIVVELAGATAETQLAFRCGQRYVARLRPQPDVILNGAGLPTSLLLRSDGVYVITGGLGALGMQMAQWMVTQGASHLILVSRCPPSAEVAPALEQLRVCGAKVEVVAADITQLMAMDRLQSVVGAMGVPLRGVIHAAGVLQDGMLLDQTPGQFAQVMAPKVAGAWNLHHWTQSHNLDFFVLFSSAAALLGSPGQGNYAAANAFMDALAHWRHQQGKPAVSINWGPWGTVGMAAQLGAHDREHLTIHGLHPLPPALALELLGVVLGQSAAPKTGVDQPPTAQWGILSVDWSELCRSFPGSIYPPYLEAIAQTLQVADSSDVPPDRAHQPASPQFEQILTMTLAQREDWLTTYLQAQLAHVLRLPPPALDVETNLLETGMDSLMVMEAVNQLQHDLQLMLYPREFYERPRIKALAKYLAIEFERSHGQLPQTESLPAPDTHLLVESEASEPERPPVPLTLTSPAAESPLAEPSPAESTHNPRLPGIVFILSSPRSGSTLLRVMLAGHPRLLSTPELHLLPFRTMAERAKDLSLSHLGEGLQRVLMDLKGMGVKASQTLIQDLVNRALPVQQVYAMLQELAGSRLLVDKSPTYAMSLETLGRAEELFENAKYIHLVRHPYATIDSFVRLRMDKLVGAGDANPYQLAETIWTKSNQNILEFFGNLGAADRHHLVYYEDLVREPTPVMQQLCQFIGIPFDPSVLTPYDGDRMTDGVHRQSAAVGDPNFHNYNRVEQALGDAWQKIKLPHRLGQFARRIAAQLGYDLPMEAQAARPGLSTSPVYPREETHHTMRGLDLCVCCWGPAAGPVVLCLHGILEQGAVWEPVAQDLAARGYRVIAPDLRGHGCSAHVGVGGSYQLLDFLGDLDLLLPQLTDQPCTLLAHSMGSVVAALLARIRPQRVASLILVETILPSDPQEQDPAEQLITQLDYAIAPPQHPVLADVTAAAERLRQVTPSLSTAFALDLAQRLTEPWEEGVRWRWDPRLRTRAGISFNGTPFGAKGYLQLLAQIPVPMLLVYGDRSLLNRPEDLARQQAAMPQAQRVMLSGGHNLHLDAASDLVDCVVEMIHIWRLSRSSDDAPQ